MNVFTKYTLQSLKKNRTRTIVTVIGIILSAAMFTAVTESLYSGQQFLINSVKATVGSFTGVYGGLSSDTLEQLENDGDYSAVASWQNIGYARVDSKNEYMPYIHVVGMSDNFTDIVAVNLIEGRMPEKADEIVLSRHLYTGGRVKYAVGDVITLNVGQRELDGEIRGKSLNEPYFPGEKLINEAPRTYTVVGICARPDTKVERYEEPGYTAYTLPEADGEGVFYTAFFTAKEPLSIEASYEHEVYGQVWDQNYDLLMYMGKDTGSAFLPLVTGLGVILILIIMAGSIALIYNSFSISVTERTKQFGLLRSIGASDKQMKRTVLTEALILCSAAIPFGLVAGCAGIAVTFKLLAPQFGVLVGEMYDASQKVSIKLVPNVFALIAAAVISVVTALISAYIPVKRAMKKTAIEAIRMSGDIADKGTKSKRSGGLMAKLFGFEGMLAQKNFRRNRKKYRTTVISLAMSLVLFISASSLCFYFNRSFSMGTDFYDFDLFVTFDPDMPLDEQKDALAEFSCTEGVDDSQYYCAVDRGDYLFFADPEYADPEYVRLTGAENCMQEVNVIFLDDASFSELCRKNGLDESEFTRSGEPAGLLYDNRKTEGYDENNNYSTVEYKQFNIKKYPAKLNCIVFDDPGQEDKCFIGRITNGMASFYLPETEKYEELPAEDYSTAAVLTVGAEITEKPFCLESHTTALIYPESSISDVCGRTPDRILCSGFYKAADHSAVYEKLLAASDDYDYPADIYDYSGDNETEKALMTLVTVFSYGFITLISLIAAANVFNTVSTNIMLRRRELAMLRSVGMPQKGFYRMSVYESMLYGVKSIILGLPVSLLITFAIYMVVSDSGFGMTFSLPFAQIGFAIVSVFAVVIATMIYSVNKIKKYNTADELKNENL